MDSLINFLQQVRLALLQSSLTCGVRNCTRFSCRIQEPGSAEGGGGNADRQPWGNCLAGHCCVRDGPEISLPLCSVSIYCVLGLSLDTRYVCWGGDLSGWGNCKDKDADPSATRHIIQVGMVFLLFCWGSLGFP